MASSWTLCLTSSNAGNQRKVVKVNPEMDSIQDLYHVASEAFGAEVDSLKAGFPPQVLDRSDGTILSEANVVANQDRVQVVIADKASGGSSMTIKKYATTSEKSTNTSKAAPQNSTTTSPRKSKRAASQAASDSFRDVIREQDRLLRAEKQSNNKTKRAAATTTSRSKPKPKPKQPTFSSQEPGRRLADGAVVQSPKQSRKRGHSQNTILPAASRQKHEDMSTALMGALKDKGAMGRILRKGMNNAVQKSYESSKAITRVAAWESQNLLALQITKVDDNKLQVRFDKGVQGKGYFEEIVDWIPLDVLKQVVLGIHRTDPEALRPMELAFLSPRIFWTLAYEYNLSPERGRDETAASESSKLSVQEALKKLLPDADWSFLRRRKTTLSEKAAENLRQQESERDSTENMERATEAIQEVEDAMANLQQYDRSQRAERMAKAALARRQHFQVPTSGSWSLETPHETDEEELLECISTNTQCHCQELVQGLLKWSNIHNWRELANVSPEDLHEKISEEWMRSRVSLGEVSGWIQHAREQSLEEIMVEVCQGNVTVVEFLRDKAHSGTPKDLAVWKAIPELLLEELREKSPPAALEGVLVQDITSWCERATKVLLQFPWLDWFATPVE